MISKYDDFGFNSYQKKKKSTFQYFPKYMNAIGIKLDLAR